MVHRPLSNADADADAAAFRALVSRGESHLAASDTPAAQRAFDDAALIRHAAEAELGLVRTYMQAGDYRQALAFAAHAAGAHREFPGGVALYAWLLKMGGQDAAALHFLGEALARAPTDAALLAARSALASSTLPNAGVLMQTPLRLAPYDGSALVPDGAQVAGSGVLLNGGRTALAPAAAPGLRTSPSQRVWVRNGLGQCSAATLLRPVADTGLVLLQLDRALPLPTEVSVGLQAAPRAPFAGSPSYLVAYGAAGPPAGAVPAWPLLTQGFFGRSANGADAPNARPINIDLTPETRGGPVFDALGRLAGVAVVAPDGLASQMVPVAAFGELVGVVQELPVLAPVKAPVVAPAVSPASPPAAPMPVDLLYERALRVALQIMVEPEVPRSPGN